MPTLADLFGKYYLVNPGGVDFSSIRVHYVGADRECRAVHASAFTVGPDIYFADGAFTPHTRAGLWLLAHEVAHVVQQSAGATTMPGPLSRLYVTPPGTPQERAADAAANAFIAGRPFAFDVTKWQLAADRPRAAQRYMAWEHCLLGDLAPGEVHAMTASGPPCRPGGEADHASTYRGLLERLGRDPRRVDEERLRAEYPGLETVRLPGSGLVVTLGELNVLPDYLGSPAEIETAPPAFLGPLIQSVRSWNIAELSPAAERRSGRPHRIAASGLTGHSDRELRAAYTAYLTMLGSGTIQFATKVAHDYLNERSLVVSSGATGPPFRLRGDRTLLAGGEGTLRAAQAAAASRQAISELLRYGETEVDSWEIFAGFPDHVERDGRLVTLREWHRSGLRDLCFGKLFGNWSTRAVRRFMSSAFRQLATITADGELP